MNELHPTKVIGLTNADGDGVGIVALFWQHSRSSACIYDVGIKISVGKGCLG